MAGSYLNSAQKKKHKGNSKISKKKKSKKHTKKGSKKGENYDSDLDLERKLKPIGGYIKDRDAMIEHMFKCIQGPKLKGMLPDILKPLSHDELKRLCLEQLEIMSKKRIRKILEGADPQGISSSGTEEESSDEATDEENTKGKAKSHAADSTSHTDADGGLPEASGVTLEVPEQQEDGDLDAASNIDAEDHQDFDSIDGEEYVEMSGDESTEEEMTGEEEVDEEYVDVDAHDEGDEMESEGEDEVASNLSVDEGELEEGEVREPVVKRKQSTLAKGNKKLKTKHPMDNISVEQTFDDTRKIVTKVEVLEPQPSTSKERKDDQDSSAGKDVDTDESDDGIDVELNYKAVAREKKTTDSQSGISTTQMEILELEMRARAIKAMLKATEIKEKRVRMVQKHKLTVKNTKEIITNPVMKSTMQTNEAQGRNVILTSKQTSVDILSKQKSDTRVVEKSPVSSTSGVTKTVTKPANVTDIKQQAVKKSMSPSSTSDVKSTSQSTGKVKKQAQSQPGGNGDKTLTVETSSNEPSNDNLASSAGPQKKTRLKRKLIRK